MAQTTKGRCADDVSGPLGGKTPPRDTGRFGFYVDERPLRLVATGRLHHGDFTLHCAPLPAHLVKIVIEEGIDGGAEVPIPTEEVSLVRKALGTFIAWPKNLVVADFIKNIKRPELPKKHARQDDRSGHSDTLKELFSVAATLFADRLQVPWDKASFGCDGEDVPLYISYNDLLEIIQDKQWLSLSILQFRTSLPSRWHWQLLVINPAKDEVVWFCSLHHKPDNRIKALVENVINKVEVWSVGITSCTGYRLLSELVLPMDGWRCFDDVAALSVDRIVKF
ncbi:hypothetical protein OROMI_015055 [Orobanche minor]